MMCYTHASEQNRRTVLHIRSSPVEDLQSWRCKVVSTRPQDARFPRIPSRMPTKIQGRGPVNRRLTATRPHTIMFSHSTQSRGRRPPDCIPLNHLRNDTFSILSEIVASGGADAVQQELARSVSIKVPRKASSAII